MRSVFLSLSVFFCLVVLTVPAQAGQVEVFQPKEEGMSAMSLRALARDEGFAKAVLEDARIMLSGRLSDERAEQLRLYLVNHSKPYIQGYKILSSQEFEDGLSLKLDVRTNLKSLREGLKKMGMFATLDQSIPAAVTWPEDVTEEELLQVQGLMVLTAVEQTPGVFPEVIISHGDEKGTYKGRMVLENEEWISVSKDLGAAWTNLWKRYFARNQAAAPKSDGQSLTISGWFSPDGVLEFDRVLKGWETAVQDVRLMEMDMQPTGVGAVWQVRVLDPNRLEMQLRSFLPQRGLSFNLAQSEPQ